MILINLVVNSLILIYYANILMEYINKKWYNINISINIIKDIDYILFVYILYYNIIVVRRCFVL